MAAYILHEAQPEAALKSISEMGDRAHRRANPGSEPDSKSHHRSHDREGQPKRKKDSDAFNCGV
ncbi:hypothetical protein PPTG_23869 [Phytophthora nicotianae INRA-310]|uniref:Uncharacterized protein n=1 Tax=Phytophthora nicotianae (strain INRA-310) TaxID=761204 RepID=W2PRP1_PHYN3|nr:hypothetical protein PPTG_23869 [Phytophthora nicotianae INRA-310]ETN02685.1 hypothetical protein PPTG_23869 [Phytophthora nicotianae INRA-310]